MTAETQVCLTSCLLGDRQLWQEFSARRLQADHTWQRLIRTGQPAACKALHARWWAPFMPGTAFHCHATKIQELPAHQLVFNSSSHASPVHHLL